MNVGYFLVLMLLAGDPEAKWPGFLGTGASPLDFNTIPLTWSPQENTAWKQELPGYGQSSPVVFGERVYVTSVEGKEKETLHIVCVDLKDGTEVWKRSFPSTFPQKNSMYISKAAPTPVVDQQGVYCYFESGDVIALSHEGEKSWAVSLTEKFGPPQNEFGLSSSPLQTDGHVIILVDDPGPSYLTSIDKSTGEVVWKTDRPSRKSWTSPALLPIGGTEQVVVSSAGSVEGYEPKTGTQLWQLTGLGGNTGTTPTPADEGRFLVAGSPGREGERAEGSRKSNGLISVKREGNTWTPEFVWTNPALIPSWGSPMAYHGHAYWVNRVGVVTCVNLATGKSDFAERIKQGCWATPVGMGDRVYIFGKDGLTTVLAAGGEFKILAENTLWDETTNLVNNTPKPEGESEDRQRANAMFSKPTLYGVAVVNGSIVLRTGSQLFCIRTAVPVADGK